MRFQEAKSIARHLRLTLRQVRSGDYLSAMEMRPRRTTRTISKTPFIPRLRWHVSDLASPELQVTAKQVRARRDDCSPRQHSSGCDEQMFGAK